jgi:transglutaminase-like putative cysteine protease
MRVFSCTLLLAWLAPTGLLAQAPVITAAGDPSVRDDTIYALVVNPSDHPEEAAVLLLDDGVIRLDANGTGSHTYRMVAQVIKPEAVEGWAEHTFTFNPERQRLRINWVRVLDLEGNVISAEPMHRQEADIPAPEGAPVFMARRRIRVSLAGVAPGTLVDYSYTTETLEPVLEGDWYGAWYITPGSTIRRSRLILDLPEGVPARIREVDLDFEPRVERVGGRVVRTWARADIPREEPEPFLPDSTGYTQHIRYAGVVDWPDIANWYDSLAQDRYEVTPAVRRRLDALTAGTASVAEALRAIHRWIAQDVRYVSISLGIGGYQPRSPDEVLSTLSGDCKDKATLFVAMARALGLDAYPVLTGSGFIDPRLPSIHQFDHAIARVDRPDGALYVDLTADLVPLGELPGSLHGQHALLIPEHGQPQLIQLPDPPASESRIAVRISGRLDDSGGFTGSYEERGTGFMQYALREGFSQDLTRQQIENATQSIAGRVFTGARGDSLEGFDGRDLTAEPIVTVRVHAARATSTMPDGSHILTLPLANVGNQDLLRFLESRPDRRGPFDIGQVSGDNETYQEFVLYLPPGWTATLPAPVTASSRFGSYHAEYHQDGDRVRIARRYTGARGIAPPDSQPELMAWLQHILSDDTRYVVLRPPAT